jgi:hypothetical protein
VLAVFKLEGVLANVVRWVKNGMQERRATCTVYWYQHKRIRKLRVFEVLPLVELRPRTDIAGRAWLRL